jgi:hypothetical protein
MNLQELELRLKSLIEVQLINALPGQNAEDLIVQKLTGAMHSNLTALEDGTLLAPDVYTLLAHTDSVAHWKEPHLIETLIEIIKTVGKDEGIHFNTPPTITIAEDANISPGDFNLIASHRVDIMEETKDMKADAENQNDESDTDTIP